LALGATAGHVVSEVLAAAGRTAGTTTTDYIAVGSTVLDSGDFSGPGGARTLLRDRRVEAAVLETARGGLLRRGLALGRVTAAAVTNIAADHLGDYGVEDLAGLAEAKLLVTRAVAPEGRAVLNADDPELAATAIRYIPMPARSRLVEMLRTVDLQLVASGHVHQRRDFTFSHVRQIWAPSAGFVISDARQEVIGIKEVGLVEYRFQPDSFEVRHLRAPGQTDVDLDSLIGVASKS